VDFGVHLTEDMFRLVDDFFCKSCKIRARLLPVPATMQQFEKYAPFQFVAMDGSGPMPIDSLHGNRYVWVLLCLSTRWAKLYYSKNKDQVTTYIILRDFIMWVKTRRFVIKALFTMKKLLTDLGGEFDNKNLKNLASTEGFMHEFSSARMHHLNPHAERYMQSLWTMMNPSLFTGDGPPELWEEVCTYSVWLKNRIGSRTLGDVYDSPYFIINKEEYNGYHRMRVLFSSCWPVTDAYSNKFKTEDKECLWVGIDEDTRGSVVYHIKSKTVFTAGMLTYYESPTRCGKLLKDRTFSPFDIQDSRQYKEYIRIPFISKEPVIKSLVEIVGHKAIFDEDEDEAFALVKIITKTQSRPFWTYLATLVTSNPRFFDEVWEYLILQNIGEDFPVFSQVHIKKGHDNAMCGIVSADRKTEKLRFQVALPDGTANYLQRNKINEFVDRNILCTSIFSNVIYDTKYFGYINPKNHDDAMSRHDADKWTAAENSEMNKQIKYKVFIEGTNTRPNKRIHTVMLIYQLQINADGTLKKYKVRLVFRGFTLKNYWSEFDIYAPVSQLLSLKLFLLLLLHFGLELYQLDVENAFLIPTMDEEDEIWCELPEGLRINGFKYHKLSKTLYGSPNSAKKFYKLLSNLLMTRFGFTRHDAEPCLFHLVNAEQKLRVVILLHVDNILTGCNQPSWIDYFINSVIDVCTISIESNKSILGVMIERIDRHTFAISNENYIDALIDEYKVQDRPEKHIPLRVGIESIYDPEVMKKSKIDETIPFRRLNMQIFWLTRTYLDHVAYASSFFARFSNCYTSELFNELLDFLCYLKKIKRFKKILHLTPGAPLDLVFQCDASFALFTDAKSAMGGIGWLGGTVIYSGCNIPSTIFTSSTESESEIIFIICKHVVFIRNWLAPFLEIKTTFVYNDNEAAISIMGNFSNSGRSKHFNIRYRYVAMLVEDGVVRLAHISREHNCSDVLTHSLARPSFENHVATMFGEFTEGLNLVNARLGGDWISQSRFTYYDTNP
jgi:hypothetical protein